MARTSSLLPTTAGILLVAFMSSCGDHSRNADDEAQDSPQALANLPVSGGEMADIILTEAEIEAVQIETVEAGLNSLSAGLTAMGRVLANQRRKAIVSYPFSARIARIDVRMGDWVETGQELVVLQSEEVGIATSDFYKAKADYELARLNSEREAQLFESGVGARKNSLTAEAALIVAAATLDAAEKKLHVLGFTEENVATLTDTHQINPTIPLFAPLAGKIIGNTAILGGMVDESTEILTIMDPSLLWVDAEIYEKDIARVRTGQEVAITVTAYPGQIFRGSIAYVSDVLNEDTRTITVRTEVPNPGERLKPGMFANVTIELENSGSVISVPAEAVLEDQGEYLLFVQTGGDRFQPRHVEIGIREGGLVEIVGGLEVGEAVVTRGNFQLKSKLYEAVLEAGHIH